MSFSYILFFHCFTWSFPWGLSSNKTERKPIASLTTVERFYCLWFRFVVCSPSTIERNSKRKQGEKTENQVIIGMPCKCDEMLWKFLASDQFSRHVYNNVILLRYIREFAPRITATTTAVAATAAQTTTTKHTHTLNRAAVLVFGVIVFGEPVVFFVSFERGSFWLL